VNDELRRRLPWLPSRQCPIISLERLRKVVSLRIADVQGVNQTQDLPNVKGNNSVAMLSANKWRHTISSEHLGKFV